MAYTGLRWGEMAALRAVQDFDMLRRRVNVSRSVTDVGNLRFSAPKTGVPSVIGGGTVGADGRQGSR